MNAAARLVHQGVFTKYLVQQRLMTKRPFAAFCLALFLVLSALSVIYVTHLTRELQATLQHRIHEQERLQVQRGQLLLERGTWMMQARIQQIAEKKLGMIIPDHKSVVVIRE